MSEQLAIMRNVGIGMRDCMKPVLWFDTYVSEHAAALQIIDWTRAGELLTNAGIYDVKSLEGKPCWVKVHGTFITFERLWKS